MTRNRAFAACILALWFSSLARAAGAGEPTAIPHAVAPATPQQVHQTVGRAIGYLQTESATWLKQRKCAACHHVAMPLWALGEADRQGYAVDRKFVTDTAEATLGGPQQMMDSKLVSNPADPPDPRPMAKGVNISAVFMAVAVQSLPLLTEGQKQSAEAIAADTVKKQRDDGSWEFFLSRPPINESQTTDAAWIIMALQGRQRINPSTSRGAALEKATAWLAGAKSADTLQDKVFKVLLAVRAGRPRAEVQPTIDELLALQRPDGGWAQNADMPSDAFATGQTLYALSLAGDTADRPEIRRAIDQLVATQKPDGSWPMTSRAAPDGKPGSAKLLTPITCAATSWATLGLTRLEPKGS
jgi:hypothetical protein